MYCERNSRLRSPSRSPTTPRATTASTTHTAPARIARPTQPGRRTHATPTTSAPSAAAPIPPLDTVVISVHADATAPATSARRTARRPPARIPDNANAISPTADAPANVASTFVSPNQPVGSACDNRSSYIAASGPAGSQPRAR